MSLIPTDLWVSIPPASLACYLIYKKFEPNRPLIHALLLLVVPSAIVLKTATYTSLPALFGALVSHWTLVLLFTVAYRLSPFHPLAQFPGPAVAKVSKIYHAYLIVGCGDAHRLIRSWHDTYGDVVRIGPNELSVRRADCVQTVLAAKQLKKGAFYDARELGDGRPIDAVKDMTVHARRRKPWTRAFAPNALKDYEDILTGKTGLLVKKMTELVGKEIDMSAWMGYFAYDFMGQLAFAREFHMLENGGDPEEIWDKMDTALHAFAVLFVLPWIAPILMTIPGSGHAAAKFQRIVAVYAKERIAKGSQYKDLWYHLTGEDGARRVDRDDMKELVADGMSAVLGGSDTSANTLSHMWYFMMKYPECCDRLRKELQASLSEGELPHLQQLPYLDACINETLRMLPPLLSGLQRVVERGTGGATVGPYFIPEGTAVLEHAYSLGRNSDCFYPIPDRFWPDRWLEQDTYTLPDGSTIGKDQLKLDRAAFAPFSTGPQACPGKPLAYAEIRDVVTALVQKFDIRPAKGYDLDQYETNLVDAHATLRGPLKVNLTLRQ